MTVRKVSEVSTPFSVQGLDQSQLRLQFGEYVRLAAAGYEPYAKLFKLIGVDIKAVVDGEYLFNQLGIVGRDLQFASAKDRHQFLTGVFGDDDAPAAAQMFLENAFAPEPASRPKLHVVLDLICIFLVAVASAGFIASGIGGLMAASGNPVGSLVSAATGLAGDVAMLLLCGVILWGERYA